jgi:hypothetical protein
MNRIARIVVSGLVSGAAYLGAQAVDIALTGRQTDDRLLVGRLLPVDKSQAPIVGTAAHLVNSVVFAAVFDCVVKGALSGPMWRRGLTFAMAETVALYPLAIFEDFHPGVRDGQLDSYQHPVAFAQQVWRHAAIGVTLGAMTPKRTP